MTPLPPDFRRIPLAHRALHDVARGVAENSTAAIRDAVTAGYGIEVDVQLTADGAAAVFHDTTLDRLTAQSGMVKGCAMNELSRIPLSGGGGTIPSLPECLAIVDGRVPVLIEVKDQDGQLGADVGPLEAAVADALTDYAGPVAVMSFNPYSVAALARLAPSVPRGLVTCAFSAEGWPTVPEETRLRLAGIPDAEPFGAAFVSHDATNLDAPRIRELKASGLAVLCWTVRSADAERAARRVADNVTFEGYRPPIPAP